MTRKILAILLALAMVFTLALTACGGEDAEDTTAADTSKAADEDTTASTEGDAEAVTMDYYFRYDMSSRPDWDEYVRPWIDEWMLENLNIVINWHCIPSGDYANKFNAALTSGTGIDLMCMGDRWTGYTVWYERNALAPLDDLLNEYAPELMEKMPQYCWDACSIDGKIYSITSIKDLANDNGFIYNKSRLEEMGLLDQFLGIKLYKAADYDEFYHTYMDARNAKYADEADLPAFKVYDTQWAYLKADQMSAAGIYTMIPGTNCCTDYDPSEVFSLYASQEYTDMVALINKWVKDGINPYDSKNWDTENVYKKGGQLLGEWEWGLMDVVADQYDTWTQALKHTEQAFTYSMQLLDAIHCINAGSAEEQQIAAMKVYNALSEDSEVSTTMRFGVEDIHWQRTTDENGLTRAEFDFDGGRNAGDERNYYNWYMAEFGDLTSIFLPTMEQGNFFDEMDKLNETALVSENMGFVLATENVQNEIAALTNVIGEYNNDLMTGMIDDYASRIDDFNAALEGNGMSTLIAEAQSQLDAWRAANGK